MTTFTLPGVETSHLYCKQHRKGISRVLNFTVHVHTRGKLQWEKLEKALCNKHNHCCSSGHQKVRWYLCFVLDMHTYMHTLSTHKRCRNCMDNSDGRHSGEILVCSSIKNQRGTDASLEK